MTVGKRATNEWQAPLSAKQHALKNASTRRWLPLNGIGHRRTWKLSSSSKFEAIYRNLLIGVDVLGPPGTSLDGGPWAIQTVPIVLVRIKLR